MYHETTIGRVFLTPLKIIYDFNNLYLLSEKTYIKRKFKKIFGYDINFDNPKTIQEKINWLQLYDRKPLYVLCTDKFTVRDYVKDKIADKYLIPLIFHTANPADITPENLPDIPFIIKTNHGCGRHIIVYDKTKMDWKIIQRKLKKLLRNNYYYKAREWQYKKIKPYILIEKLLLENEHNIPIDYKFICYNGIVKFIEVITDRYTMPKVSIYDPDWLKIEFDKGILYPPGKNIEKPINFEKMKELAEILAKDFKFVRVDFYNILGKIYFGEMTFSPAAGFETFPTPDIVKKFGFKLNIGK